MMFRSDPPSAEAMRIAEQILRPWVGNVVFDRHITDFAREIDKVIKDVDELREDAQRRFRFMEEANARAFRFEQLFHSLQDELKKVRAELDSIKRDLNPQIEMRERSSDKSSDG